MSQALADVLDDLRAYRDAVVDIDPVRTWAHTARHHLPGCIFWVVNAQNMVTVSVGRGFAPIPGLESGDAEGTKLSDWTKLAAWIVQKARRDGEFHEVVRETEGPAAGRLFITSAVLHEPSEDVVLLTIDVASLRDGMTLLTELADAD